MVFVWAYWKFPNVYWTIKFSQASAASLKTFFLVLFKFKNNKYNIHCEEFYLAVDVLMFCTPLF